MVSFNQFPFPLFVQYVNVCAHLETQCLSPFVASRIQSDWLPSYTSLVSIEMVVFALGAFQFRALLTGSWALSTVPCGQDQWDLPDPTPVCFNAATSHFKLNQVIVTWVTRSIPYLCPPVAGLQDWATSPNDCLGSGNWTLDAEHVKLWHYTWAKPPTNELIHPQWYLFHNFAFLS